MLVKATRWFLITAPVVAGVIVLIVGTAGSISTMFGIVLIGIGPIVWMWNWFLRMSFAEEEHHPVLPGRKDEPAEVTQPQPDPRHRRKPAPGHARRRPDRPPRRPS